MLGEMKNISMEFGPTKALDGVNYIVHPSEIHGLLGENGAGKTTLMNILAGAFRPTTGEIFIDGKPAIMDKPQTAAKAGIRFIHQELNLCNDLTVFENLFLSEEIHLKTGLLNKQEMARQTREVVRRMQVDVNPWTVVGELEPAQKQMVEIARALLFKCELIIMDEPTTALSQHEIDHLFVIMRQLKSQGVSFIYISHKMPELFEICDNYTVLRDGKFIVSGNFAHINEKEITSLLIGRELVDADLKESAAACIQPEVLLEAESFGAAGFEDVALRLHRGEIIAITGLQGSGSAELADALFGILPFKSGTLHIKESPVKKGSSIRSVMRRGIGLVPRNRKERGILTDLSIYDNLSMGFFNTRHKKVFINRREEKGRYEKEKNALQIKAGNPANPITSLSGGNQQKVILGRWLETDADIYLLDNPTQGIDVGTKFEIYKLILSLAAQGKGILVFSSEYPEIWKVADSCIVLYKGRVNARLTRSEISEESLMYYSTGSNLEGEKQ
ncbi:MAG: sugar ABC transporter ATP-binding protein [Oscillospiraceae bacterium]